MERDLILVNSENEIIGYGEKLETHQLGQLHRAFSIFVMDLRTGDMLLQRRASSKYHSPGLWTNACCSHPRKGEEIQAALNARLKEELGLDMDGRLLPFTPGEELQAGHFYECGSFQYFADFGDLKEHEIDRVFLLPVEELYPTLNPEEADQLQWISREALTTWLNKAPQDFTQWFQPALKVLQAAYQW